MVDNPKDRRSWIFTIEEHKKEIEALLRRA